MYCRATLSTLEMQLFPGSRRTAVHTARFLFLQRQQLFSTSSQLYSATTLSSDHSSSPSGSSNPQTGTRQHEESTEQQGQKKTVAELDEEMRQKLEGMSGEGGVAGIELENGKPVAMKRGVRENMFRLI
jgi:hypothetical protein